MRYLIALFAIVTVLAMTGCASVNPFPKRVYSTPPSKTPSQAPGSFDPKTNPYTVFGRTYYPLKSAEGYDEVGIASWYGKDFHGKKTANGRIYNMYGVSAAHKTLPLGTQVRVTNLENRRSIVLVINDRGPFVGDRIIDLSYGAAQKLDTVQRGVAKVRVTAIGTIPAARTTTVKAATSPKYFHVRVGAFSNKNNAVRTYHRLVSIGYKDAVINTVRRNGQTLHVVQAGSFSDRNKAERVRRRLLSDFPTCYITS